MTDTINSRITDYLARNPDATTIDIADAINEDLWSVQLAICHLDIDGRIERSCRRRTFRGLRPGYRVRQP